MELTQEQVDAYVNEATPQIFKALMPENVMIGGKPAAFFAVEGALQALARAAAMVVAMSGHFQTPRDRRLILEQMMKQALKEANAITDSGELRGRNFANMWPANDAGQV